MRRLYDSTAPNYALIQFQGERFGIRLTGNPKGDVLIHEIVSVMDGYGIGGLRPQTIVRDQTGKVVA